VNDAPLVSASSEDLVRGVLGALGAAESDVAVAIDGVKVAVVERGKRVPIATGTSDEDSIGQVVGDRQFPDVQVALGRRVPTALLW